MSLLPFLKKNKEMMVAAPSEKIERKSDEETEEEFDSLEGAMQELGAALTAKDYKTAAAVFRAAQEFLDSQPHLEGSHI
jgi:uncharacterized protein YlxP (DUF503 family)